MSKPVYVLNIDYHAPNGAPVIIPEVFDSLDGAKAYVKESWGVKLHRMTQSYWSAIVEADCSKYDFTVRLFKRTVFKR